MIFAVVLLSLSCAVFFYCQALSNGLGRKRWAAAGLFFGPAVWPMFCMQRRMKVNRLFGFDYLIWRA